MDKHIEKIAAHLEKANFAEYAELIARPWKFFWVNFMAGLFRGLGTAVGFTVIFAVVIYISITVLKHFMSIPIIGQYVAQLVEFVNQSVNSSLKVKP